MKQASLAGLAAIISISSAVIIFLISPSGTGVEYIGIPGLIILGLVSAWFWNKGSFGTQRDKDWVERYF